MMANLFACEVRGSAVLEESVHRGINLRFGCNVAMSGRTSGPLECYVIPKSTLPSLSEIKCVGSRIQYSGAGRAQLLAN